MAASRTDKIMALAKKLHHQEQDVTIKQNCPVETDNNSCNNPEVVRNTTMQLGAGPSLLMPLQNMDLNTTMYSNGSLNLSQSVYNVDINNMVVLDENLVPLQHDMDSDNDIDMLITTNEVLVKKTASEEYEGGTQELEDDLLQEEEFRSNSDVDYEPDLDTNNNNNSTSSSDDFDNAVKTLNEISTTKNNNNKDVALKNTDQLEHELTKKGTLRKRTMKCKKESKEVLNMKKMRKEQETHKLKLPCNDSCKRSCKKNIAETRRQQINAEFWTLNWTERRMFVLHNTKKMHVHRRSKGSTEGTSRRSETISYYLKDERGEVHQVCKVFYLATLGYSKNNDTILKNVLHHNESDVAVSKDMRGKHAKHVKINRDILRNHIQKYHPCVSHYRREHAPNRLYLPSDITIKGMHDDFHKEFPNLQCSYELYRHVVVHEMNISFAHLGHEECEICETHKLHDVSHSRENLDPNCEVCKSWQLHKKKYTDAREAYKEDVKRSRITSDTLFFSADLQKVIMLPRLDMFKSVIFTPRIIAFNESFVPLGATNSKHKPVATIWHEAIAGRKKEDIISSFHQFFILHRDSEKVVVWLDNCSAQNKNWALMSFLIYIINSTEIETKEIAFKFFEKGHTFMSADSFHHQVEMALKTKKKVYDFPDFYDCIKTANSGRVLVKEMRIEDFSVWPDYTSQTALKKINPRPYLSEMTEVKVVRGSQKLMYKKEFEQDSYTEIEFLQKRYGKGCQKAPPVQNCRGISSQKKEKLLKELSGIMPASRLNFWKNLPVSDTATDLITDFE